MFSFCVLNWIAVLILLMFAFFSFVQISIHADYVTRISSGHTAMTS